MGIFSLDVRGHLLISGQWSDSPRNCFLNIFLFLFLFFETKLEQFRALTIEYVIYGLLQMVVKSSLGLDRKKKCTQQLTLC